jgi:hypothetical protein
MNRQSRLAGLLVLAALLAPFTPGAASAATAVDIGGTWNLVIDSPHGTIEAELVLQQDAGTLTGTYDGDAPVTGSIAGDQVRIAVDMSTMAFEMQGKVATREAMSGQTVSGSFPWRATRKR